MNDALRERFNAALDGIETPPGDPSRAMAQGRRRRGLYLAGSVAVVVALACASTLAILTLFGPERTEIASGDNGYVFTFDILGYDPGPNHVRLRYTSEWAGDEYPGSRDCTWSLYRDDGTFISDWEYKIGAQLRPRVSRTTEITAPELPGHIEASCGPRHDRGVYVITSEPEVERRQLGTYPEWVLVFELDWIGTSRRGSAVCRWTVHAREGGRELKRGELNVGGGNGHDEREVIHRLTRGFKNEPGDADVDCETL